MRRIALLVAAVVGIAGVACGGDSNNSVAPKTDLTSVTGVWSLLSVNGATTPLILGQNDTATLELLQSRMTLNTDATFAEVFSLRLTGPSGVQLESDTTRGTFQTAGTTLTFLPSDGSPAYQMVVTDEHTLTENDPGLVLIYKR